MVKILVRFEELFQQHFGFAWRCLRGLGVQPADVDDLAQEVFMVLHRRLGELGSNDDVRPWIYGTIRHVVHNYRRGKRRANARREALEHEPAPEWVTSPSELLEARRAAELVADILGSLTPKFREVFLLVEIEELPVPDVARALGVPINTAYSRLRLARGEFRAELQRRGGHE